MRNLPGLTNEVFNRASSLADKAIKARNDAFGAPPSASIAPARVVNGVATLRLYDYIDPDGGYWGISANEFADALDDAGENITSIVLRINSGGGSVWDGLAILNTLRSHGAPVTAMVDGVAASAASFIAVACDEVIMMPNSRMMIHDAMGLCIGQAVDMREYASFLDDTSTNIAEIYAERAGGETVEWRTRMTANGLRGQWYSAQQAVDEGLADKVGTAEGDDPDDKAATCHCGSNGSAASAGMEHKNECPEFVEKPAPAAPAPPTEPTNDRRLRHQQRRHAQNELRLTSV